jgi:hypothetical protein
MIDFDPIETTRKDRIFCQKAGSDLHEEWCPECILYPDCDEAMRNDIREQNIKDLEVLGNYEAVNCKDCKYFEYDSIAKVDGVPIIVAHEICTKWGHGCKTKENGFCFLGEPREEEVEEQRKGKNEHNGRESD